MKHGTPGKFKFKKLKAITGYPEWQCLGLLDGLWLFTARERPAGDIGRGFSNRDIAFGIEWDPEDIDRAVAALVECGWLDELPGEARLGVHDWADHCEDSVHMQLFRARAYFADGRAPEPKKIGGTERADGLRFYAEREPRPTGAGRARKVRTTRAEGARTVRYTDAEAETDASAEAETETRGPSAVGESVSAILHRISPAPPKDVVPWVLAVTRDPPATHTRFWRVVVAELEACDALGVLFEAVEYAEKCADPRRRGDLGELSNPGGYVMKQVAAALKKHGRRCPMPPGRVRAG